MHLSVAAYIILYFILFIFIHSYLVGAIVSLKFLIVDAAVNFKHFSMMADSSLKRGELSGRAEVRIYQKRDVF